MRITNQIQLCEYGATIKEKHIPAVRSIAEERENYQHHKAYGGTKAGDTDEGQKQNQGAAKFDGYGPQVYVVGSAAAKWLPVPDMNKLIYGPPPVPELLRSCFEALGMHLLHVAHEFIVVGKVARPFVCSNSEED